MRHDTASALLPTKGTVVNRDDDDQLELLRAYAEKLRVEFDLNDLPIDIDSVLSLAGIVAHAVVRPAAPVTTFLVGYAAGLAVADRDREPEDVVRELAVSAERLARESAQ